MAWGKDITEVQCKLQSGTNKAVDWLMANRLLVNNEKSTCMLMVHANVYLIYHLIYVFLENPLKTVLIQNYLVFTLIVI